MKYRTMTSTCGLETGVDLNICVLTPSECDVGSQKCHMGPAILSQIGAHLGSHVLIKFPKQIVICSAWLDSELQSSAIQLDKCVYQDLKVDQSENSNIPCVQIQLVKSYRADKVEVTVIFTKFSDVEKFKSEIYKEKLKVICSNCLWKLCIMSNFIVDLENTKLGKLYGISYIQIGNCLVKKPGLKDSDTVAVVVGDDTSIVIEEVWSKDRFLQLSPNTKCELGGLEQTVQILTDLVRLPLERREDFGALGVSPPKGVLLLGPPGCGKTSVVKYVAQRCNTYLICVNGPEVISPHPGESEQNLRRVFDKAISMSSEGPCIIFLDEIDSLCPRKGSSGSQEARLTSQLLQILDELGGTSKLLVIGATNRPGDLDPALRRPGRLDREILVSIPNIEQRHAILKVYTSRLALGDDVDLRQLSEVTNGYVGADLALLVQEVVYSSLTELQTVSEEAGEPRITMRHFTSALKKIRPSLHRGADIKTDLVPVHWDDIGDLAEVKQKLIQAVEWPLKYPKSFEKMGLPPPRGVLLYGPPGCCKTTLVRAVATSCHVTFLSVSGAQLYSPFVGQSEKTIIEIFQRARACAPSIIFFDEIDSVVGKRSEGGSGSGVQQRVLSCLLNEMDGVGVRLDDKTGHIEQDGVCQRSREGEEPSLESDSLNEGPSSNSQVYVIAATNRPEMIDEALLRPGRIDSIIFVPPPNKQARRNMLSVFTKKIPVGDVDFDWLASRTKYFSGADIENLCREAALNAITEDMAAVTVKHAHFTDALRAALNAITEDMAAVTVKHGHFTDALRVLKPSLSAELIQKCSYIKHRSKLDLHNRNTSRYAD
ncbi:hypothetical protein ScPMuIL_018022 [Solemya velum]